MKQVRRSLTLVLAALIWGVAFVAQSKAMDNLGPFTFNAVRCLIGGIVLIPVIALMRKKDACRPADGGPYPWKPVLTGGLICGVILFVAANLQQFAFAVNHSYDAGKAGFITALYIIFVPIFGIFFKKRPSFLVWISAIVALGGLYLLCVREGALTLETSDLLVLACSVVFACHILAIDHFNPRVNGVLMSCIQFFVCGVISLICAFIFEKPRFSDLVAAYLPILYAGIMSCGVAYTLQIVGQKGVNPFLASLLLSLESVFAVLAGWLLLGQALSLREIVGCAIIFVAIILAQITLPARRKGRELPQ